MDFSRSMRDKLACWGASPGIALRAPDLFIGKPNRNAFRFSAPLARCPTCRSCPSG